MHFNDKKNDFGILRIPIKMTKILIYEDLASLEKLMKNEDQSPCNFNEKCWKNIGIKLLIYPDDIIWQILYHLIT